MSRTSTRSPTNSSRTLRRWLLVVGALTLLPGLGLRDPWPPDEPRFVLSAHEMLTSGEWLVTTRAGEVYSDKPPIFIWIEAVLLWLTGSIGWAVQLPSLIAALSTLAMVYDLGRRLWNRRVGWWAAIVLLATFQFALQARTGQIDMTLTAFVTLGFYGLIRHLLLGPSWGWYTAAGVAIALGVMTKGVGILPLLVFLPYGWARLRGWRQLTPRRGGGPRWVLLPAALLGTLALWLVPLTLHVEASGNPDWLAYRDDLLFRQTVDRYTDSWAHLRPPWYFVISVLPWAWLPTTLALPWLVPAWSRRLQRRDARYLILLGWILLVIGFFSLSPGKRGVYMLPTAPVLALAVAPLAAAVLRLRMPNRLAAGLSALVTGLLAVASVVALVAPERARLDEVPGAAPFLALLALATGSALWFARPRRGFVALAATFALLFAGLGAFVYPRLDPLRSGAVVMQPVAEQLSSEVELAIVAWREQLVLQADRPIVHFGYTPEDDEQARAAAAWLAVEGTDRAVLLPARELAPCFADTAEPVSRAHRREWRLARVSDLTGRCDRTPRLRSFRSTPLR